MIINNEVTISNLEKNEIISENSNILDNQLCENLEKMDLKINDLEKKIKGTIRS